MSHVGTPGTPGTLGTRNELTLAVFSFKQEKKTNVSAFLGPGVPGVRTRSFVHLFHPLEVAHAFGISEPPGPAESRCGERRHDLVAAGGGWAGAPELSESCGLLAFDDDHASARPDGTHLTVDAAAEVAQEWLGPALVASARV